MDVKKIRNEFPIFKDKAENESIIYFDNSSSTLTPQSVIDAVIEAYETPGNTRSGHGYSVEVMEKCSKAREKLSKFINAKSPSEIILAKSATEAINLLSRTFKFEPDCCVLTSDKEHNSNMAPWHNLSSAGVKHQFVKSQDDLTFDLNAFEEMLTDKVQLVSMAMTSVIDGYTIPAEDVIKTAHDHNTLVLLDAVQTVPRQPVDVQGLDVDFLVFSISNMCGPAGVGVLYGKYSLLEELEPLLGGGGAVMQTTYEGTQYQGPPVKFEAGNQNYPGIIGAGAAVDFLNAIGMDNIYEHVTTLNKMLSDQLLNYEAVSILGPEDPTLRGGMCNFNIKDMNPHDIAIYLEECANILVRSGIQCAHPWFLARESSGAVSVLSYLYNTQDEIDLLAEKLKELIEEME